MRRTQDLVGLGLKKDKRTDDYQRIIKESLVGKLPSYGAFRISRIRSTRGTERKSHSDLKLPPHWVYLY